MEINAQKRAYSLIPHFNEASPNALAEYGKEYAQNIYKTALILIQPNYTAI